MPIVSLPNGQTAEFPDSMQPQQIEAVLQQQFGGQNSNQQVNPLDDRQSKLETFKKVTGIGQPSFPQHLAAGMLDTLGSFAKSMPDFAPTSGRNPFMHSPGQSPVQNFDAYKTMGVEDKPFYTPEGAVQTAGQFLSPGRVVKAGANALGKVVSPIKNAFNKIDHEVVGKGIQATHDALEKKANDMFNTVAGEVQKRGINQVKIDSRLIDQMQKYLPKTQASKALIKDARSGEYSALRKAQTELWERGTRGKSSQFQSDRDIGEELLDLRDRINGSISKHLEKTGHHDLNEILNQARSHWKELKDTYFGDHVPSAISNLVTKGSREIPDNLMNVLRRNSVPMEKIRQANPFISENLAKKAAKENAINKLKTVGKVGGTAAAGGSLIYLGGKQGLNYLKER